MYWFIGFQQFTWHRTISSSLKDSLVACHRKFHQRTLKERTTPLDDVREERGSNRRMRRLPSSATCSNPRIWLQRTTCAAAPINNCCCRSLLWSDQGPPRQTDRRMEILANRFWNRCKNCVLPERNDLIRKFVTTNRKKWRNCFFFQRPCARLFPDQTTLFPSRDSMCKIPLSFNLYDLVQRGLRTVTQPHL